MKEIIEIDLGRTRGISREVNDTGRVVLPKDFRNALKINSNDLVELFLLREGIFIRKLK